jgi:hypothetical protein
LIPMAEEVREEDRLTEDDIARGRLNPRGLPGGPDKAKMTPQREKNMRATSTAIRLDETIEKVARNDPNGEIVWAQITAQKASTGQPMVGESDARERCA